MTCNALRHDSFLCLQIFERQIQIKLSKLLPPNSNFPKFAGKENTLYFYLIKVKIFQSENSLDALHRQMLRTNFCIFPHSAKVILMEWERGGVKRRSQKYRSLYTD